VTQSNPLITVVVADDHPFYRDGLTRGLGNSGVIRVVGEAETGRDAIDLIRAEKPAVALVDYQMPDLDGLAVVTAVNRDDLPTRVLLLSAVTDQAIVYRALEEGAAGYLPKDSRREEIISAVQQAVRGQVVVPPALAAGLASQIRMRSQSSGPVLSEREREVLTSFAEGKSIPGIAAELDLAPSTVKTHAQRLYEKLGVSDRAAAVAEAMRRGLLE
jgi:two-component system, NarL family, nitrate/nitrite response regulator NarL